MSKKHNLSPEQDNAANPTENVWVQANAGTGKTSVLVQRLLRILFRTNELQESGILCLTYTNAGAGEMRNRILASLREWAIASDDDLKELLSGISVNTPPTSFDIEHARQIFFRYIDMPETLKIKTIHGFCEEILRKFPLEAGISPSWSLVSEVNQRVLLQEAFSKLVNTSSNIQVNSAFSHILNKISETYIESLLDILSQQYKYFFQVDNISSYREYFIDTIRYFFNLNTPVETFFSKQKLEDIIKKLESEIKAAKKPAQYLIDILNNTKQFIDNSIDFEKYKNAYLKQDGEKKQNILKKDYLIEEQDRVYVLNQNNIAQRILEDSIALFDLSAAFAEKYKEIKRAKNILDFEDLILYTRKLFSSPENMGWVLSQLNVNLKHILVDEAQDTSPAQWDILRMLSGDFFTDGDTKDLPKSLFVVGDTKQSIYGFQGADPKAFTNSRLDISTQIQQNLRTIHEIPLEQSFRSLAPILKTVDFFFNNKDVANTTGFLNNPHKVFRQEKGGLVEINRLVSKQEDEVSVEKYVSIIADEIKKLIDTKQYQANEIMVLVQNRIPMAAPLVKELKKRSIDVAGSDRIILPKFPAIKDLLYLIRFCLDSTDDYSLCCVLKSPIFRLKEADIFELCKIKNVTSERITVFDVLREKEQNIYNTLSKFIELSKIAGPYSFFSYVLNEFHVRDSMIAALGNQIIDPLEEFMTICLSYERTQTGTLKHFLKWFITGGSQIKRDMDASSGVRIATIHGSKGLEAPVIFLIDTVKTPRQEQILNLPLEKLPTHLKKRGENLPPSWIWSAPNGEICEPKKYIESITEKARIAEYYRLLYVAMTRARDRLYIYGHSTYKNAPEISWFSKLWNVLSYMPGADVSTEKIRITNNE